MLLMKTKVVNLCQEQVILADFVSPDLKAT